MGLFVYVKMGGWGKIVFKWIIVMVGCVDNMGDVKIIFIILFVYVMKVFLGISVIKLIIVFRICV